MRFRLICALGVLASAGSIYAITKNVHSLTQTFDTTLAIKLIAMAGLCALAGMVYGGSDGTKK